MHLDKIYSKWALCNMARPYLMVENVRKYLPKPDATVKGHMNQICQHIRSTQTTVTEPTPESEMVQEDKCIYIFVTIRVVSNLYRPNRHIPNNISQW
jgi:hypothetical protein